MSTFFDKIVKAAKKDGVGELLSKSKYGSVVNFIPTDAKIINLLISSDVDKGIPIGKTVMFAGPTGVGKTLLAMSAIKNAQDKFVKENKDYAIILWDSEFAGNINTYEQFGIDVSRVLHIGESNITVILQKFTEYTKDLDDETTLLHVFDSAGAWITDKTLNDAESGNEARDMTIAGARKKLMNIINAQCGKHQMGAIIINHVYVNIGGYGEATTVSGGGMLYIPSTIVEIKSRSKWKDHKGDIIGNKFKATLRKGRQAKESMNIEYAITYSKGISPYYGLMKYALEGGFITETKHGRSKAYFITSEVSKVGEEKAKKYLDNDWETLYYSDEVFGELLKTQEFKKFINDKHRYGFEE